MMYRVAERLAEKFHAQGIVTGEAIGEQASQTLTNLRVLSEAVKNYPVLRPLLGFDKEETEAIGRKIGTYDISIQQSNGCTAVPKKPSTQAKLSDIIEEEKKLDINKLVMDAIQNAELISLWSLSENYFQNY